jgi:hypothetical protein
VSLITRNWLDFFSENLKKSFCYDGAKLWNSLPADIRDSIPPPQALFRENLPVVQICEWCKFAGGANLRVVQICGWCKFAGHF